MGDTLAAQLLIHTHLHIFLQQLYYPFTDTKTAINRCLSLCLERPNFTQVKLILHNETEWKTNYVNILFDKSSLIPVQTMNWKGICMPIKKSLSIDSLFFFVYFSCLLSYRKGFCIYLS